MEDVLMKVLIVVGAILIIVASPKLKRSKKNEKLPLKTYWRYMALFLIGSAMVAAGFVIGGI